MPSSSKATTSPLERGEPSATGEKTGEKPDRYMPSVFTECDKLKQAYDRCFTRFFQDYIKPDYRHNEAKNPCSQVYETYRECIERNLAAHRPYEIDLDELKKQVLFTPHDRFSPPSHGGEKK